MREYLINFMDSFEYPEEAKAALLTCFDSMMADADAASTIKGYIKKYENGEAYEHNAMLSDVTSSALAIGMPWQTAHLIMGILLSKTLKRKYEEKGISEQIWHDTMLDFKCKLFECHRVYHIWGSFVGHWWAEFFSMNIFALGRLQYQMKTFDRTYDDGELHITPDTRALWIHIPSAGPLTKELRQDSYRRAREFFSDYFGDSPAIFICSSWLLYPEHENMLSPKSNVVDFMHDFKIIERIEFEKSNDLWRIFEDAYVLPYNMLPRNNSMRRAYAERLCEGKTVGRGVGFFVMQ